MKVPAVSKTITGGGAMTASAGSSVRGRGAATRRPGRRWRGWAHPRVSIAPAQFNHARQPRAIHCEHREAARSGPSGLGGQGVAGKTVHAGGANDTRHCSGRQGEHPHDSRVPPRHVPGIQNKGLRPRNCGTNPTAVGASRAEGTLRGHLRGAGTTRWQFPALETRRGARAAA